MPQTVKELTAYCGLYCGDCHRYQSRYSELARDLKRELERVNFLPYAKAKGETLKCFQDFPGLLETLGHLHEFQCEHGCRAGGGCSSFPCQIIACCREKGFEGCWECHEFEGCNKFEFLKPYSGDGPKENLRKIRALGFDGWAAERAKFYVWD